ncbi:M23 family metallopeptidase [Spirochaeta africana]|uniref:Metalloendopeptidase-like membrane protein n=1 Tax=Spirochaeta africana (strain ATCC 700263 / DSM 8902 / Z-7692) TaxID=889378 RepID=H9UMU6_SPIAZ|nr:M23 family metallopeptidase [Spirochaeta africana]AFG38839.1 metalloendopeptidase-like membrane protein [Spirochaeta africana DSM 8902]
MNRLNLARVLLAMLLCASPVLLQAQHAGDQDFFELTRRETSDGGYSFHATNRHIIPIFVSLSFPQLQGLEADQPLPIEVVLEAGAEEQEIARLSRVSNRQISFRSSAVYVRGDPSAVVHDDSHVYLLPYEHGRKYRVTQGYNGPFTHVGENQYAIDFDLEEGDPVHAARSGLVVEIKQDSSIGGPSPRYTEHANFILIQHDDGSFGNYVHLQYDGALVTVGDRVQAGDLIGLSGNTGRSSGPHLHFDVRIPTRSGRMQSLPTLFKNHDGEAIEIEQGRHYYARHPGKPEFEAFFGSELTNQDFRDHTEAITTGSLDVRVEQIDSTYVLFLQNGTDQRLEIDTTLQLRGMEATTPLQLTHRVDPQTEVFLSILRPQDGVRQAQYGYQLRFRELD